MRFVLARAAMRKLTAWWDEKHDIALLRGVRKHGIKQWDRIK